MAKNNKKIDLKSISDQDLTTKIAQEKLGLKKLEFNHAISQIENPLTIRQSRRNVARMLTELSSRKNSSK